MRTPIPGCVLAACFVASVPAASAQLITQWNFNSAVTDASTSTGSVLPSTGGGTASAIGSVTASFAAGSPRDGASDNTAWSLASWPSQGTASGTAGAQFMVSTVGFTEPITISFDLRQTTTASERFQLQATSDGTNFLNVSGGAASFGTVGNNTATSFDSDGLFLNTAASSAAFVQSITYSFADDSVFENNAHFGFRLVSVFEGTQYDASGASASYGTSGTLRLDLVTVSAASAAVPEPSTTAIFMGACALAAVVGRRRRRLKAKAPKSIK
jgi:hypothetical protein